MTMCKVVVSLVALSLIGAVQAAPSQRAAPNPFDMSRPDDQGLRYAPVTSLQD